MAITTMRQLLEAGVHFGHQAKRWNPKMKKYIFTARNDIHVIDLQKTMKYLNETFKIVKEHVAGGGKVLFVGTKKQAQEAIREEATRCGMYYINNRWLGGMLTNFDTIKRSVSKMKSIENMFVDGSIENRPRKEQSSLSKTKAKLVNNLEGIKDMKELPTMVYVVDTKKEQIAVNEANRLGLPIVGIVDTNCDPDEITFPIPANDDAIRAIKLLSSIIADAVLEGKKELVSRSGGDEALLAEMEAQGEATGEASAEKPEAAPEKAAETKTESATA